MKKNDKLLIYIIFFGLFLISISPFIKNVLQSNCNAFKEFLSTSYKGVVVNKFINSEQHSAETVEIKSFNSNDISTLILDFDITDFYNQIKTNDTILKEVGKDTVFIMNKKGKQMYILDFNCKN